MQNILSQKQMTTVNKATYSHHPSRYELKNGDSDDAPLCPYGNKYQWIGYDMTTKEYVRFTKSVFKLLIAQKEIRSY